MIKSLTIFVLAADEGRQRIAELEYENEKLKEKVSRQKKDVEKWRGKLTLLFI